MVEFREILCEIKEKQETETKKEIEELNEKLKKTGSIIKENEIINHERLLYCDSNRDKINNERIYEQIKSVRINHRRLKTFPNYLEQLNPVELFANNNCIDEIPAKICLLTNLRLVSFFKNKLYYFPMEICFLHNLRILDLGDNLIEEIPREIGLLSCLLELHLQANLIKDLPEELYELKKLRVLNLGINYLTYLSPSIILLKKLTYLNIVKNEITELLPEVLEHFNCIDKVICDEEIAELFDINTEIKEVVELQTLPNDNINDFKKLNQSSHHCSDSDNSSGNEYNNYEFSDDDDNDEYYLDEDKLLETPTNNRTNSPVPMLISSNSQEHLVKPSIPNISNDLLKNLEKCFPKSFTKQPTFPNYPPPTPPISGIQETTHVSFKLTQEDKNRIIYKKNILENITKFMRECDHPNSEKIDVIKEIKSNIMFSGITKTRIIEAFKNPNLLKHLKTHDNASHSIFNTDPIVLLEYIYSVIESFETKSTLYEIINSQIMKIFEWNINEVNMLVSIIYKFASDYNVAKTIEEFQYAF